MWLQFFEKQGFNINEYDLSINMSLKTYSAYIQAKLVNSNTHSYIELINIYQHLALLSNMRKFNLSLTKISSHLKIEVILSFCDFKKIQTNLKVWPSNILCMQCFKNFTST